MSRFFYSLGVFLVLAAAVEGYVAIWTESSKHGNSALVTVLLAFGAFIAGMATDDDLI